jgi:hypothetical protein
MTDWVIIYSSNQAYKCNFVKALLEEYNIPYQEVNKIDSAVVTVGRSSNLCTCSQSNICTINYNTKPP